MRRLIHNLRQRPEEHRRHILHVSILVCAVVMFSLWVVSLGHTLTSADVQKKVSADAAPLSALKANFIDGYKSLSAPDTKPNPSSDPYSDMLE